MKRSALKSAPLSPTARAVLVAGYARWEGPVSQLSSELQRAESTLWRTLASLAARGFLDAQKTDAGVLLRTTGKGRAMIVRNVPGTNPRRSTSPRRNAV